MNLEYGKMMEEVGKGMGNIFGRESSNKKQGVVEELEISEEPWTKPSKC